MTAWEDNFFRSFQFVDLLQEDGKAGAFLDHNKNLKKDDVPQTNTDWFLKFHVAVIR